MIPSLTKSCCIQLLPIRNRLLFNHSYVKFLAMSKFIEKAVEFIRTHIMSAYPLTTNHFLVEWGGTRVGATEVTGLSIEIETLDYKEGSAKDSAPLQMPGGEKLNNITLKRGVVSGDNEYAAWMNEARKNAADRRDLSISLLNSEHEPIVSWRVHNAFPVKLEWSDLKANGNEAAIESLEIAHQGIEFINE